MRPITLQSTLPLPPPFQGGEDFNSMTSGLKFDDL